MNILTRITLCVAALFTFSTAAHAESASGQIQCMARNAYYEAGNQGDKGMIAVSQVVMNRTKDDRFPSTPCSVIHQKRHGTCQFSWVCSRRLNAMNTALYERAQKIAEAVYFHKAYDVTFGALFYHANYVRPRWASVFSKTTRIGDHIFYRG